MVWEDEVTVIKGVGEKAAERMDKLGIRSVGDLIGHYPRAYDEVKPVTEIRFLHEGELSAVEVRLLSRPQMKLHGKLKILSCVMVDHSGTIDVTWFNMPFLKNRLRMGTSYILRGRVVRKRDRLVLEQPKIYDFKEFSKISGRMLPVYPLTAGITNNALSKAVGIALRETEDIEESLPTAIRKAHELPGYRQALEAIHFPKNRRGMIDGRKRLVFDELFFYALALRHIRESASKKQSTHVIRQRKEVSAFLKNLPFELTGAQERAIHEIFDNMESGFVMSRLVQGDVGSGKTIVAIAALYQVVANQSQGALMVPTEVLARQHARTFTHMLPKLRIGLLTGSLTAKEKREIKKKTEQGEIDILIGTHALIEEDVRFKDLALVITDEQHRFGVRQRETFFKKGEEPHVLAMSATPIPRTLALILYGDMDLTVIDEKPANRLPVKNALVDTAYRPNMYHFMQKRIAAGEQIYVICPMVEEGEDTDLQNVTIYAQELAEVLPPSVRIGVLHGRMKPGDKDAVMESFAKHELDILVATTVIEVGIDVPNATTMLIENAERFGLATLHQLRGRIGRGSAQSYCVFMMGTKSEDARTRLRILERSNDGFHIASEDLKLRGQGDLFGTRQSGDKLFVLADIYEDADILEAAAKEAKKFPGDIKLTQIQTLRLEKRMAQYMGEVTL